MRAIKHIATGIILIITASCIDPYHPRITESQDMLVINGSITSTPGEYTVEISRSFPLDEPRFRPVKNCIVEVADENGTTISYSQSSPGIYSAYLDNDFLGTGKAYQLYVQTPDGSEYFSEFDSLLECPPIDKLYYEKESRGGNEPGIVLNGLQFFVDVKGTRDQSGNFLWKLEETYEYTASYQIQYIWDGGEIHGFPSDSLYTCYRTDPIQEIYAASTRYLTKNELTKYPLTYVSDESNKLWEVYSLLVEQHSLSDNAYFYWNKLKSQVTAQGGLYETQPYSSAGNIFNADDSDEIVLGIFYVSQVNRTRIMVEKPFDYRRTLCKLDTVPDETYLPAGEVIYLISVNEEWTIGPPYGYASIDCFDCQLNGGGTLTPPDYWEIVE